MTAREEAARPRACAHSQTAVAQWSHGPENDVVTGERGRAQGSPVPRGAPSVNETPTVLFVCVKNAGKSQMAAALMRQRHGDTVDVYSSGTRPGSMLNAESVASLEEVGASVSGEHPKPIDDALLDTVDRVIILGEEARIDQPGSAQIDRWITDEPSARGIEGRKRMGLIRDDITARVDALAADLYPEA